MDCSINVHKYIDTDIFVYIYVVMDFIVLFRIHVYIYIYKYIEDTCFFFACLCIYIHIFIYEYVYAREALISMNIHICIHARSCSLSPATSCMGCNETCCCSSGCILCTSYPKSKFQNQPHSDCLQLFGE